VGPPIALGQQAAPGTDHGRGGTALGGRCHPHSCRVLVTFFRHRRAICGARGQKLSTGQSPATLNGTSYTQWNQLHSMDMGCQPEYEQPEENAEGRRGAVNEYRDPAEPAKAQP